MWWGDGPVEERREERKKEYGFNSLFFKNWDFGPCLAALEVVRNSFVEKKGGRSVKRGI